MEKCAVCGENLHKDEETKKMEMIFAEIWRDADNRFGKDGHWHTAKKSE